MFEIYMEKKQISPVIVFTEISAEAPITKIILISVNLNLYSPRIRVSIKLIIIQEIYK